MQGLQMQEANLRAITNPSGESRGTCDSRVGTNCGNLKVIWAANLCHTSLHQIHE